jgi:DNA-binding beta-propeller fold protein YncE
VIRSPHLQPAPVFNPAHVSRIGLCVAALVCLGAGSARAQNYLGNISTSGYGQNSGQPFGLAFGPNGDLYVALSGISSFVNPQFFNNNVVLRVNPVSHAVTSVIPVGLFPEEISFASALGGPTIGIVTNSTDGTVSIFDLVTEQILGTPVLPGGFFASFPFSVVINQDGKIAYISTGDGTNTLRAIDIDPNSPTAWQHVPAKDLATASGNAGRMMRLGDMLYLPTTAFDPFFSGSTASVEALPLPGSSGAAAAVKLGFDNTYTKYPSTQDVVIAPDGIAYFAGTDMSGRIYGFQTSTGQLCRAFPSGTMIGVHTGLALSPDGTVLVVCDIASNEISFLDVARGKPISVVNTALLGFGFYSPNDAVFSPDGSKVFVTMQGSEAVLEFSAPPSPPPFSRPLGLSISNTAPSPGNTLTLSTIGAGPGEFVAILADDVDWTLDLGAFGVLHFTGGATVVASQTGGDISLPVTAPVTALQGKNFLCQAVAVDLSSGIVRLSDEIPVVIQ